MKIAATLLLLLLGFINLVTAQSKADPEMKLFRVVKKGKIGFINESGKIIIKPVFAAAGEFSEGLAPARVKGLYGYIDQKGDFIISPQFEFAEGFQEGIAVAHQKGKPFYIDRSGRKLFDNPFAAIGNFHNGLARVRTVTNKSGIVNKQGRLIVDTLFQYAIPLKNRTVFVIGFNHKPYRYPDMGKSALEIGVIDSTSRFIIPFGEYSEIEVIENGYFLAQIPEKTPSGSINYVLIDPKGQLVAALKTNSLQHPLNNHDSVVAVLKSKISGFPGQEQQKFGNNSIQTIRKLQASTSFSSFYFISTNHLIAQDNNYNYALIDKQGKQIPTIPFTFMPYFLTSGEPVFVKAKAGWGLMDTTGNMVLEPQFDYVDFSFAANLNSDNTRPAPPDYFFYTKNQPMVRNSLWGIATKSGQILTPPLFEEYDQNGFQNGLLKVAIDNRLTYLNRQGKIVWQENKPKAKTRLNLDYRFFHPFRGDSQVKPASVKPKYSDVNYQHPIQEKTNTPENTLSLVAKTGNKAVFYERYQGFKVFLSNPTSRDFTFQTQDYHLEMAMQAQDTAGKWQDISYLSPSMCGNSDGRVTLKPGNYWEFVAPVFEGSQKTNMRFSLKYQDPETKAEKISYSNQFSGKINPGQFWRKKEPSGLFRLPYLL